MFHTVLLCKFIIGCWSLGFTQISKVLHFLSVLPPKGGELMMQRDFLDRERSVSGCLVPRIEGADTLARMEYMRALRGMRGLIFVLPIVFNKFLEFHCVCYNRHYLNFMNSPFIISRINHNLFSPFPFLIILMINYSQAKPSSKFLLQLSRNQDVPKLVSINDHRHKQNRNKLLQQARIQAPLPQLSNKRQPSPDVTNLRHNLEGERRENEQMKLEIKKLKEVNQGLIVRIKLLKNDFERTCQQQLRKQRVEIFEDVQEHIQIAIEKLTVSLKYEQMTPMIEETLEKFMTELLQINSLSAFRSRRTSQDKSIRKQSKIDYLQMQQSRRTDNYLKRVSAANRRQEHKQASRQQYASIMQRLTNQSRMSKSIIGTTPIMGTVSQDARIRTVYTTTPQKRRKIFD